MEESLKKIIDNLTKEISKQVKNELLNKVSEKNGLTIIAEKIDLPNSDAIKNISFELKNQLQNLFMLVGAEVEGKAHLSLIISDNLVKEKNLDAVKIIRELSKEIQGGGGGQAFYATAGGKNPQGIDKAIENINNFLPA